MVKIIEDYYKQAELLKAYSQKLSIQLSKERNIDKLHELEARKATLDAERYEIMRDMRDILKHLSEEEQEQWRSIIG